jgi:hypothetical protein
MVTFWLSAAKREAKAVLIIHNRTSIDKSKFGRTFTADRSLSGLSTARRRIDATIDRFGQLPVQDAR